MKFPSLSRIPKYKRFTFEPRYYDPVKEDIRNRTQRIKEELKVTSAHAHRAHIKSAFDRRERRQKSSDFMQLLLIVILLGAFGGWIIYGNVVLYIFMLVFPLYLYLRTRKFFQ
ncbi:MAG: hypothetical protein HC819_15285 [Cyclobacteriaceae bacterium]|nr:hypothetical protein [Cyclobacteriaceae bacterium]